MVEELLVDGAEIWRKMRQAEVWFCVFCAFSRPRIRRLAAP